MKCPICTKETAAGSAFCQHCGAKLPGGTETASTATASAPSKSQQAVSEPASGTRSGRIADVPEETLWEGTYSPKAMIGTFIVSGILSVALAIAAVIFFAALPVLGAVLLGTIAVIWAAAGIVFAKRKLGVSYKLTNQMFYHREGVLTRTTDRIELIEIHDVAWTQGLIERAVGVGKITIRSADKTDPELPMPGIENAEEVAKLIDKARRAEQVRRGRRIEFSGIDHPSMPGGT